MKVEISPELRELISHYPELDDVLKIVDELDNIVISPLCMLGMYYNQAQRNPVHRSCIHLDCQCPCHGHEADPYGLHSLEFSRHDKNKEIN